jgi:hypothetical protein
MILWWLKHIHVVNVYECTLIAIIWNILFEVHRNNESVSNDRLKCFQVAISGLSPEPGEGSPYCHILLIILSLLQIHLR